ncbi:MAG: EamA family transporter RarD, partial [Desulfobacterales bacterium]
MKAQPSVKSSRESLIGVASATTAFMIWGLTPIYFKVIRSVPAFEILMHRIVWSCLFLILLALIMKKWPEFKQVIKNGRTLLILLSTTLIVAGNWFVFIWAINHDKILQTSLGYYINPLVNIMLGMIFLKERLRLPQMVSVLLAGIGVGYLTIQYGKLPWISLYLAFSFGFYGLIRKVAPVGALIGLTVETLLLLLPALGYLIYFDTIGVGTFFRVNIKTDVLLLCAALITAPPLLFFTTGARRLHLSTVGILQYIAPSCTFLLAIFIYQEPFKMAQLWTFVLIWSALIIYS